MSDLGCWSCRFITETDQKNLLNTIKGNNYDIYFNWYPFTGEEAPMPLDDIVSDDEQTDEEEGDDDDEDEDGNEYDFMNYWNQPPMPSQAFGK